MSQKIEFTAEQFAAFDQIIAQKKKGNEFIFGKILNAVGNVTGDIAHVVANVAPVIAAATNGLANAGAAEAGGEGLRNIEMLLESSLKDIVKHVSVEQLVQIRQNIVKKG